MKFIVFVFAVLSTSLVFSDTPFRIRGDQVEFAYGKIGETFLWTLEEYEQTDRAVNVGTTSVVSEVYVRKDYEVALASSTKFSSADEFREYKKTEMVLSSLEIKLMRLGFTIQEIRQIVR